MTDGTGGGTAREENDGGGSGQSSQIPEESPSSESDLALSHQVERRESDDEGDDQ